MKKPSPKLLGGLLLLAACAHGGAAPAVRHDLEPARRLPERRAGGATTWPALGPDELVSNGGFELASSSNPQRPAWWDEDEISAGYALDTTVRRTGSRSLRVEFREAAAASGYSGTIAKLDVRSLRGRRLTLEAFVKRSSPDSKAGIWLKFAGEHGLYVNSYDQPFEPGDAWARHTLTVTVPPDATRLALGAAIHEHDGVMWVDDVSLRVGPPSTTVASASPRAGAERYPAESHANDSSAISGEISWPPPNSE
jgi:hypothetical protein